MKHLTSEERKLHPVFSGFLKYFPKAAMAVSAHSLKANEKHNPGAPLHWDRSKSTDEMDALVRHIIDKAGGMIEDEDGLLVDVAIAWRGMANLEKVLEDKELEEFLDRGPKSNTTPQDKFAKDLIAQSVEQYCNGDEECIRAWTMASF